MFSSVHRINLVKTLQVEIPNRTYNILQVYIAPGDPGSNHGRVGLSSLRALDVRGRLMPLKNE